jgi:uncharacterized protein (DUF1501 family)
MSAEQAELSRRDFVRTAACAAVSTVSLVSTVWDLRMINAAYAQSASLATDYKALVCLFLFGGNDANNLIVPTDNDPLTGYPNYANLRTVLAIPQASLVPINPLVSDGHTYGLHPNCAELAGLFNAGKLAVQANVGTLVEPLPNGRTDYQNSTKKKPPQLFSHNDQQVQWQTSVPDQPSRTGWGGRCADLLHTLNQEDAQHTVSMAMSLAGINTFEVGSVVNQFNITTGGAVALTGLSAARTQALKDLLVMQHPNLFEDAFATVTNRAIANADTVNNAIIGTREATDNPPGTWVWNTAFPTTSLGRQMKMIARLIAARATFGHNRQIFFCSVGGYDTHGDQIISQNNLYNELSKSMNAFYQATVQLGVDANVTTFTKSDFGRTFPANSTGSDHGWGNHQLVMGGSVLGQQIYGQMPTWAINGPQDTGLGRWVPSTAVDEYSATLAKWFGVSGSDLNTVFPNLSRFAHPDLGFMSAP